MARIIMQPSGKSVECAYGDTVLMASSKRQATRCPPTTAAPVPAANGQGHRRPA